VKRRVRGLLGPLTRLFTSSLATHRLKLFRKNFIFGFATVSGYGDYISFSFANFFDIPERFDIPAVCKR